MGIKIEIPEIPEEELTAITGDKRKDALNKSKRNKEILKFVGETIDDKK